MVARPRDFSEDDALEAAMRLFWERGYADASVRDLCGAMGIGAGSFYATFGSKEDLFRLALRRYLRSLDLGPPGPEAVSRYLGRVVADREPRGCLLVGSASAVETLPASAHTAVASGLQGLEDFLWHCLRGRPGAREDAAQIGTAAIGLQVMHKVGIPEARLREIADRLLISLDLPSTEDY